MVDSGGEKAAIDWRGRPDVKERPRGLFVIPSLRCGGAERVFTLILNGLAAEGLDMHVGLCQCEGYWLTKLSPDVTVHDLGAPRVRQAGWPLIQLVRRLQPEAVLSTSFHLNTVTGLCRRFFPRSTRVYLREVSIDHFDLKGIHGALLKHAYRSADGVVALVDGMRTMVEQKLGVPVERIARIFNPLEMGTGTGATEPSRATAGGEFRVMAVGSLTRPKGMDRLIAAFPKLCSLLPSATLTILGEGPERGLLEQQIRDLGMELRIRLPGFSADVRGQLAECDLFVLPSRFEGMPNALLEAIAARRPVVVLDHPGGTREVMEILGLQNRITQSLDEWNEEWFRPIAESTLERARQHFAFEAIVGQYRQLLFGQSAPIRQAA